MAAGAMLRLLDSIAAPLVATAEAQVPQSAAALGQLDVQPVALGFEFGYFGLGVAVHGIAP